MSDKNKKPKKCNRCNSYYTGTTYKHNLTCPGITGFRKASELINDSSGTNGNPSPVAVPDIPVSDTAQPADLSDKSVADIEKEIQADIKVQPSVSSMPHDAKPGSDVDKTVTVSAANIIYIRSIYRFVNSALNKFFKTTDFDMTDDELKKLEDCTLATLAYYKVKITPPVVLAIVLVCAYVLPILKHIGVLDKLKTLWNENKNKILNRTENKDGATA